MGETVQASLITQNVTKIYFHPSHILQLKTPSFFSDHSPVITWLNVETNICNKSVAHANDTLKRLPIQFCWENDSTQKFKDALRSSSTLIQEFLNENEPITNVNTSLEKVEHILIATSKRCLKIKSVKRHKRVQSSSNKKWFDKECRFKRHELRKLANQKHMYGLYMCFWLANFLNSCLLKRHSLSNHFLFEDD